MKCASPIERIRCMQFVGLLNPGVLRLLNLLVSLAGSKATLTTVTDANWHRQALLWDSIEGDQLQIYTVNSINR